jgi:hypothetical protein
MASGIVVRGRLGTLNLRTPTLGQGLLFPSITGAPKDRQEGIGHTDLEGLDPRIDPPAKWAGNGPGGHLEEPSHKFVQGNRRAGERLQPLEGEWLYPSLDETYLMVRDGGHIVSVGAVVRRCCLVKGRHEIGGLGIAPSQAERFWSKFLKGLVKRRLIGLKLVISDAHEDCDKQSRAYSEPVGKGFRSIGYAMPWRMSKRANRRWPPPRSAEPSCYPMLTPRRRSGARTLAQARCPDVREERDVLACIALPTP